MYATSRLLSFATPPHPVCPCFLHSSPHMQHRVQCELARKPKNCASTLKGFTACKLISFIPWRLDNCNSSSVLEKSKLSENVLPRRPHWFRSRSGEMLVVESQDGGPNLFGQFLEEALVENCQVPHERNFMHHVGSCLALLRLQSTGNTNVSIRDPRCSARLQRKENQMFGGESQTRVPLQNFRQVCQCDKTALCQGSNRKQRQHHTCTVMRSRGEPFQAKHWPRVRTVAPAVLEHAHQPRACASIVWTQAFAKKDLPRVWRLDTFTLLQCCHGTTPLGVPETLCSSCKKSASRNCSGSR